MPPYASGAKRGFGMSRGTTRERQVRAQLEADGWVVVRAAGSLGPVDLVALRNGTARLIQVKGTAKGPWHSFGPDDRQAMLWLADRAGAEAWLAWWPPRREPKWIASWQWPQKAAA
jgi:Holliday junction resolvase